MLDFQAIKTIPDEIFQLVNLKRLSLKSCILLTSISPNLTKVPLESLDIHNCVSLKTPPPEIQRRGFKSIIAYLKGLLAGSVSCKQTKLMLVGLGEAGKTSLLNCLRRSVSSYDKDYKQFLNSQSHNQNDGEKVAVTDGINIKDWGIKLKDDSTLTYSMWDFAGQSVYYNTHQFFLTSRAVYILVW